MIGQTTPGDDKAQITADIMEFINQGADMVVCSGGMSVDPDDRTPGGIRDTGARVVTYGAPVLPGAMLLIAYYEKEGKCIPILGFPDVSCMRSVLYLTWFCQESWQTMKFSRKKLLHTEKAVSA